MLKSLWSRHAKGHEHHHHPHPKLSEAEILARAEEFNRKADTSWKAIRLEESGHRHVLDRPFGGLTGPSDVYRFGLVLGELRVGPGLRVLDFGAGSCWLSSCLNRMGCRTVAVDVSPTALELGRELFAMDRRHREELSPQFLEYDGHTLPVPDASVDRIACFDAFHHVPNQNEVLSEMYRVLRPGGRVVLAEPGEGHSHSDHSAFDQERFEVLENEFDLLDFERRARYAGFTDVRVKPYLDPATDSLSATDYARLAGPSSGLNLHAVRAGYGIIEALRNSLRAVSIVILSKGEEVRDSRSPGLLRASLRLVKPATGLYGRGGAVVQAVIEMRNEGDTWWRHEHDPVGGTVSLGAHLVDASGRLLQPDVFRAPLPRDLGPREQAELVIAVPLPAEAGRYVLRFDPVDDNVAWFSQSGSPPLDVPLEVVREAEDRTYRATVSRTGVNEPLYAPAGTRLQVELAIRNVGLADWPLAKALGPGAIRVGAQLLDAAGRVIDRDHARQDLTRALAVGEAMEVALPLRAPRTPGRYALKIDLLQEHVCWFEERGSSPLLVALVVTDEVVDSAAPGILHARLELLEPARAARVRGGEALPVQVRATNLGNTVWRRSSPDGRGYVRLGAWLRAMDGSSPHDYWRATLDEDVPPGGVALVSAVFAAPPEPGDYTVVLDLVDEGVAWFAGEGSTMASFSLQVSPEVASASSPRAVG